MKSIKLMTPFASLLIICFACNTSSSKADIKEIQVPDKIAISNKQEVSVGTIDSTTIAGNYQQDKPEDNKQKQKINPAPNKPIEKIDWDKKIIKTANLNIEVKDYKVFANQLHDIVKQFGGYIFQEQQNESAYKIENTVSIKIPVAQFDDAMNKLTASGEKIVERKIISEDVTSDMVDTKSRIEAKKEVRLRYLDLLKQAKNMQDILQVQNEIDGIQEQLESAAGRVAYLNHSSAFSTINLTFYQVTDVIGITEKEPTYLHKIKEAFSGGLKWISDLMLELVALWPLIIAVVTLWIVLKKRKSTKSKSATA